MNGYAIGLIIEGALALVLIVALIAVCVKAKKARAAAQATEEAALAEVAAAAVPVPAAVPEGEDVVSFAANDRSFSEAYATLNEEQKRYFILLREYALHKQNATETRTSRGVVIRSDKKIILKLIIRRGIVVAAFKLENDLLRDYRRNSEAAGAFRLKETELYIESENALETACGMVDLMLQQYAREREEAIRRRRARQAARRAKKRAERLRAAQAKQDAAEAPAEEAADPAEEAAEPAEAEAYAGPAAEPAEAEAPDGEQTAREE